MKVIDFMGKRVFAAIFSLVLVVGSLGTLAVNGLNFGLDFTGGTLIEVGYEKPADLEAIRSQLTSAGYESFVVVNFGSEEDVLIKIRESSNPKMAEEVLGTLRANSEAAIEMRRVDYVGPAVGGELRDQGLIGMLAALGMMMFYVAFRFQQKFSVGAVSALAHDVIITLGIFSFFQWQFDLTVLAAVLAIIGYSLNDTIVVSDRIRENFRKIRDTDAREMINISLSQTLGRTLITSITTLLVVLALFIFGGEMIHGFSQALLVGVVIGTYSSIYVSASILLAMKLTPQDLVIPEKEGAEFEEIP